MTKYCDSCPNTCHVDRNKNIGFCRCSDQAKVALCSIHLFEEPCLSGKNGSGTIFFSHCNMRCVYCQNYEISDQSLGTEMNERELANAMMELEKKGACNINLVTPTIHTAVIIPAVILAKKNGLSIPIVYNTNGYENIETIKQLNGLVDIYLPDMKYGYDVLGKKYSKVEHYVQTAMNAIEEMVLQVGENVYDENGILKKGVIIRHLILPGNLPNTRKVLNLIKERLGTDRCISLLAQYFPTHKAKEYPPLNRKLVKGEVDQMIEYLEALGFEHGYIQQLEEKEEQYVPKFKVSSEH